MPKKTYTSVPPNYPVCLQADCPMASACLHQLAYARAEEKENYLLLINPKLCSRDARCRFYRNSKPVVYARGFTNFQQRMYPGQYREFVSRLLTHFGHNAYYERRRGATALSPREQEIVLAALREAGVKEELKFDSYEENINWND